MKIVGLNAADAAFRHRVAAVGVEAEKIGIKFEDALATKKWWEVKHEGLKSALLKLDDVLRLHTQRTGDQLTAPELYRRVAAKTTAALGAAPEARPLVDFTDVVARDVRLAPSWLSSHGANVTRAGEYEMQCEEVGQHPDPQKLAKILGGVQAHFEMTTLGNGLRYVAIKTDAGKQIYDDQQYGGVSKCNCGAIHGGSVSSPDVRGTDMGDGFQLSMTVSGSGKTSTYSEKKFETDTHDVEFHAVVEPPNAKAEDGYVFVRIKQSPKATGDEFLELDLRESSAELTVFRNLATHDHAREADQVSFKFGANGQLEEVVGISHGYNPNPDTKGKTEVLRAMRKGQGEWFRYAGNSEQAKMVTEALFGGDLTTIKLDPKATLEHIVASATANQLVARGEVLRFA